MKNNKNKIFGFLIALVLILIPMLTFAAGLVPDCGVVVDGVMAEPCDFNRLMELANKVINFLLFVIAAPLMALILVYAGWLYISDAGSEKNITKAKDIMKKGIIGFVCALAAWLIIHTIMISLGYNGDMYLSVINNMLV